MKPKNILRRFWNWLPPQPWPAIFATIIILLLIFLAAAFLIQHLKGALP